MSSQAAKIAGQGDNPEVAKAVSSLLGDKWLQVPQGSDSGGLGGLDNFAQKDSLIKGILDPSGDVSVKGTGDVNGTPVVFLSMAYAHPGSVWLISAALAVEQFGYGLGFTAYLMFMILVADGPHKTAHYAICTGFMALGMMLPGMAAGWGQTSPRRATAASPPRCAGR